MPLEAKIFLKFHPNEVHIEAFYIIYKNMIILIKNDRVKRLFNQLLTIR